MKSCCNPTEHCQRLTPPLPVRFVLVFAGSSPCAAMPSSSAALDHMLAEQCGVSEDERQEFSSPFSVLFTICMYPTLMFVAARVKERWPQILQGVISSVAGVGSCATKRCKVSRKMLRDASYE